jgi:hypothetical protein
MMKTMMKMMAVAAFALAAGGAQAQSQYGPLENFYYSNVDVDNGQYAGRVVNPGYWLVSQAQWADVDSRWTGGGYVRLGISSWKSDNSSGGGIPFKELALAYARAIGADVVIYTIYDSDQYNWSSHKVAFYARAHVQPRTTAVSRPTSAQATAAINRAQDECHEPHVAGGVRYDAQTDTYNWIGPKFGEHRSKSAVWFLDHFGTYL